MKITKRQLRRIISEAIDKEPFDITKIEPGVSERIGYDYTVTERRPSLFQGIGGQPMERVAFEYRISPEDDTIVDGSLPAVPKGMPLKDFFEAGLNGGFPDMYPPIPPQNVATGTAKGMPRVDGWEKMLPEGKMKITKRQLRRIIKEEKARLLKEIGEQPIPRAPGVEVYRISMVVAVAEDVVDDIQGSIEDGMEFNKDDGEGILEYDIRPETSEYFNKPPRRGNY